MMTIRLTAIVLARRASLAFIRAQSRCRRPTTWSRRCSLDHRECFEFEFSNDRAVMFRFVNLLLTVVEIDGGDGRPEWFSIERALNIAVLLCSVDCS